MNSDAKGNEHSQLPEGTPDEYHRLLNQMETMKISMDYNLLTLQYVDSPIDGSRIGAMVAHNPCDLNQFQVLAYFPTMDRYSDTLKVTESAQEEAGLLSGDNPVAERMAEPIMQLAARRFQLLAKESPLVFAAIASKSSFAEACRVYQKHYGLTEGGDFNAPLNE